MIYYHCHKHSFAAFTNYMVGAVVVAQLAEWSLPTPEDPGLNLINSDFLIATLNISKKIAWESINF